MVDPNHLGSEIHLGSQAKGSHAVVSNIETFRSFEAAEETWRGFERKALSTPYQRYDWLEAWYRHVGRPKGLETLIVVAYGAHDRVVLLWPFAVGTVGGSRVASWPGGKFANYNLGLYDRNTVLELRHDVLVPVLKRLREDAGIDALTLKNQPEIWQGALNPFLNFPHQPSPSNAYSLSLRPDFETLYAELRSGSTRKKLRRSERRIADEYGSCVLRRPDNAEEVDRVLDVFMRQKAERMQEKSIPNVFTAPGVMSFFRELAVRGVGAQEPLLDLFWLDAGGHLAATWAGTAGGGRLSGIFNSFDLGDFAQHQPGEVLLRQLIEDCCERGLTDFDLGVGEAQYKDSWCPRIDRLFDSFLPLSASGWMHTSVAMTGFRLKRAAKQSKFLRDLTDRFR